MSLVLHKIKYINPVPFSHLFTHRRYSELCLGEEDRSTVMDRRKKVCDRQKALLNGHFDRQYVDVTASS